jgi:hypothetical protein
MTDESWRIPSKLAVMVIGVLLSAAISFNVWAVSSVYDRPTHAEVKELIDQRSPYARDRAMILMAIDDAAKNYSELKSAIQKQTAAVVELRTVLRERER